MSTCHNNPEKSSTNKINKHTASGYSLFTHCSFDTTKNKLDYYRGKNCMKNFCLRRTCNKNKEMKPLTKKEEKKHNKEEVCHLCRKKFGTDDNNKKYHKLKDHCHYTVKYGGAAHDTCNLRYKTPENSSSFS